MTALIEAQRLFDQNTKLMQVHGDIQSRASEIGKF
jgi:flagellar basal body rod protein FlgG